MLECADKNYNSQFQGRQGIIDRIDLSIGGDGIEITFELVHPLTKKPFASAALVRLEITAEVMNKEPGITKTTRFDRRRY